jgi:hypothetical protein
MSQNRWAKIKSISTFYSFDFCFSPLICYPPYGLESNGYICMLTLVYTEGVIYLIFKSPSAIISSFFPQSALFKQLFSSRRTSFKYVDRLNRKVYTRRVTYRSAAKVGHRYPSYITDFCYPSSYWLGFISPTARRLSYIERTKAHLPCRIP